MKKRVICLCLSVLMLLTFNIGVNATILGDIDNNGALEPGDHVYLMRHLANWKGYETLPSLENADVDGVSGITLIDVICLARNIAGWKGYENLPLIKEEQLQNKTGYAVVEDYSNFELNNHIELSAYIDGSQRLIKVKEVTRLNEIGEYEKIKIENLGLKALTNLLEEIEGLYTYTINEDSYCSIVEQAVKYRFGDYFKVTDGAITFKSYNEVEPIGGWSNRGNILRIDTSTKVYLINTADNTVNSVIVPIGHEWMITNATEDTCFYVDKLGYGDPEILYEDRPSYGIASVVYIETSGEPVYPDSIDGHLYGANVRENEVAGTCEVAASYDQVLYCIDCKKELSRIKKTGEFGEHNYYQGKCTFCGREDKTISYTVVKEFVDFELYDHIILKAYIEGELTEIKVNIVQYLDAEEWVTMKVADLDGAALTNLLNDIEGIYTYTVDEDGYYAIKEQGLKYRLGDYLKVRDGRLFFRDYNEVEPATGWGSRGNILRVNSSTKIYTIDGTEVTSVNAKFGKEWYIDGVTEDSMFYVDELGFGDYQTEYEDRPNHGIASIVYIQTSGDVICPSDYRLVFVDDALTYTKTGTAEEFGIGDGEKSGTYTKFSVDGEAYGLVDFKAEDVLYVNGLLITNLNPGVYLVDADSVIVDYTELDDIAEFKDYALTIATGITAKFRVANIKAANIDLFGYNDVVVTGLSQDGTGVKNVTFKDYLYDFEYDDYIAVTKSNKDLTKYLGGSTVKVLIAANKLTFFSTNSGWPGNTIRGIIIDDLLA